MPNGNRPASLAANGRARRRRRAQAFAKREAERLARNPNPRRVSDSWLDPTTAAMLNRLAVGHRALGRKLERLAKVPRLWHLPLFVQFVKTATEIDGFCALITAKVPRGKAAPRKASH